MFTPQHPYSYELAEYARKEIKQLFPCATFGCKSFDWFEEMVWIEDLKEMCEKALKTETQVIVKREDEMAFAELNGSYLKFVEDAARLLY